MQQVLDNAKTLAETLLAGGVKLVSGGTDNHLILADVTPLGTTGRTAEQSLERCGITINKNMIPFDQRKPVDPSGVRIGTPALTSAEWAATNYARSAAGFSKCSAPPRMRCCTAGFAARWPKCAANSPCRAKRRASPVTDAPPRISASLFRGADNTQRENAPVFGGSSAILKRSWR